MHIQDGARANVVNGNVIGNDGKSGVGIQERYTKDNEVYDIRIGVSRGEVALPNVQAGVRIAVGARSTRPGPGNVIANNPVGIQVDGDATDFHNFHTITGNSIYGNAKLGIDLRPLGARNRNDRRAVDKGANQQQNSPVLAPARTSGDVTTIRGTLNSTLDRAFTVQFFSNPKGTNEGKILLGEKSLTTGDRGNVSFAFRPATAVAPGRSITATVTAADGSTSEFSAPRTVTRP